jgi:hypothetical protein
LGNSQTDDPERPNNEKTALLILDAELTRLESLPPARRIDPLGDAILKLSKTSIFGIDERKAVFERAKNMMLRTPGYGDHYREMLIDANKVATIDGPSWNKFSTERGRVVETLKLLPTAESVEALAGLLDCDETRNVPMEGGPLSQVAASALSGMIENPPAKFNPIPWREWRERVASGKQTFQFKGSPVRYNFEGPVAEAAQPKPAARTRFHGTPADLPVASSTAVQPPRDLPMKVGLGVALVVVVVFGCVKWRARDRGRN